MLSGLISKFNLPRLFPIELTAAQDYKSSLRSRVLQCLPSIHIAKAHAESKGKKRCVGL